MEKAQKMKKQCHHLTNAFILDGTTIKILCFNFEKVWALCIPILIELTFHQWLNEYFTTNEAENQDKVIDFYKKSFASD